MQSLDRRRFLLSLATAGLLGPELLARELPRVDDATVRAAGDLVALDLTEAERDLMLEGLRQVREQFEEVRGVAIPNGVPPAILFDPVPPGIASDSDGARSVRSAPPSPSDARPADDLLPFLGLTELGALLRGGSLSSTELTGLYLERLKRLGGPLECVINLTEERALEEADRADRELQAGHDRGPLHGIPWGAKDLFSARGYPTTWGAKPFADQVIDEDATVVRRLTEAGAVLTAKLTLGSLAWGDVWFGGKTRNPWNLEQGSSGSSAGSASATAAGLVGFSLGTETWGSIVSPSTRCGTSGLRPTFGRISRHGAMALSWTMDKVGPICRSIEDCGLVFEAIHGPDSLDPSAVHGHGFERFTGDPTRLRIGYFASAFAATEDDLRDDEWRAFDHATLDTLRDMGFDLVPFELPDLPVNALAYILSAEASAAFDQFTRDNRDDALVRQIADAWPNAFRQARFIPAVEYIQAQRVRTLVMRDMAQRMADIDAYVTPSFGSFNLLMTNLTGHPTAVLPNGFRSDGTPTSISFVGKLFGEAKLLAVAQAYQEATDFHRKRPSLPSTPG